MPQSIAQQLHKLDKIIMIICILFINRDLNDNQIDRYLLEMQEGEQNSKFYLGAHSKKTKFEHYPLKEEIIELLIDHNFKKPTLVQAQSLPITLQDNLKNLCIIIYAYNGAGKTLTYLIPIFNSLENIPCVGQKFQKNKDYQIGRPQAMIVVPTQALLAQVYEYLLQFADYYQVHYKWNLKVGRIYSNVSEKGHILIGLARKMQQKLKQSGNFDLSQLKWVVFDECDKVKEDTIEQFSDMLKLFADSKINTSTANLLITSATGNKQNFRKFIQNNLTSHNILELDSKDQNKGLAGVTHFYSKDPSKQIIILNLLQKLAKIQTKPQVIIFFNSIPELRNFYLLLKKEKTRFLINDQTASDIGKNNLSVGYIHGQCSSVCNMRRDHLHPEDCSASKTDRVTKLRNKQVQVLLGTETIGRGIDIRTVTLVINYNEPMKNKEEVCSTAYIHRVGRTGRYSDEGIALTFVSSNIFIKLAEEEQKIKFHQMKSEDDIIRLTVECTLKNSKDTEENSKHRFQYA